MPLPTSKPSSGRRPIWYMGQPTMGRSAFVLCIVALLLPAVVTFALGEQLSAYQLLVWLVLLIPAFLLSYFRGWKGVATALAAGMAVLALAQLGLVALGQSLGNWPVLIGVVLAYVMISLGVGFLSDRLHEERMRAEELALTDELTGSPNRRHVRLVLEREFAAARRGRPLVIVFFDLDGFKAYNDQFGHSAGDDALREFSRVLLGETRSMNVSGRWGGEEFISVLSSADLAGALIFVERVRSRLRETQLTAGSLTVSAGLAAYQAGMGGVEDLLASADAALYHAKRSGPDAVRVHQPIDAEPSQV